MKEKEYIDFENQGWEAMLQTLDREMPTKKKRRGLFWLFLSLGLVATGSGLWFIYQNRTVKNVLTPHSIQENTPQNTPMKAQADALILDNTYFKLPENTQKEQNTTRPKESIGQSMSILSEKEKVQSNQRDKKSMPLPSQRNVSESPQMKPNSVFLNTQNLDIDKTTNYNNSETKSQKWVSTPNYAENKTQNTQTETQNNDEKINSNSPHGSTESFNSLITAAISPLSIEISKDSSLTVPVSQKPIPIIKNQKLNGKFGISAGIHSENLSRIDGFQAGFIYVKPWTKRWSVATGLHIRQTQTVGDSIKYYKAEAILDPSGFSTPLQKTTSVSLDKLYYLELPLSIQYHFKRPFSVSMGIKTAYLLDQTIKDSGNLVYWTNGSVKNNQVLTAMVTSQTLGLNRWDASWISGVSYAPNKHISMTLRYDLGLVNILKRNNWAAYNRYFGLNATYLF